MNKMKVTIFLITMLNISYVIFNKGIKPLLSRVLELIKLIYVVVLKPLTIYVYTNVSDFITYLKSSNFKNKIQDMKDTLNNSLEYFKQNNFESIRSDITKIKNIVLIVIKHFYDVYKEYPYIVEIEINEELTEVKYTTITSDDWMTTHIFFILTNTTETLYTTKE